MKKTVLIIALMVAGAVINRVNAQDDYQAGYFKHFGIGLSASSLGVGLDVATTLGNHFMLRGGVDLMPDYTFNTDVDVDVSGASSPANVDIEASLKRTQYSLLLNCYPSRKSSFFIAGGLYFGGKDLVTVDAKSDELKRIVEQYPDAGLVIDQYKLPISADGSVKGGLSVSGTRPYLGFGFGRLVPHKRVGFLFEMGVQFHGTPKVYSTEGDLEELGSYDTDDELSKIVDKLTVYPVVKFRLCGRIF